jgi:RNA polymerase sigma-70 factor (ECF subfamily)
VSIQTSHRSWIFRRNNRRRRSHYVSVSPCCTDTRPLDEPAARDATFDDVILPHLGDAYRLARWLVGNEHDADDVVQEASLRALRYFETFSGRNARGWFLTIVRNTCRASFSRMRRTAADVFDEELHSSEQSMPDPEALLLHSDAVMLLEQALRDLPERSRELLVLREVNGLTYQEVASVLRIPIGTVMSGLSRARSALRRAFPGVHAS